MTGKPLFGDRIAAKTGAVAAGEPARQAKYVSPKVFPARADAEQMGQSAKPEPVAYARPPCSLAPDHQRRLSDKITAAIEHAIELGLKDIAERLTLVRQATVANERKPTTDRRHTDRRFFKAPG